MEKLCEVTALGDQVTSTSQGSYYICAILHNNFAVAVRHNGDKLSLRVEPRNGNMFSYSDKKALKNIGFGNGDETYMSQHFSCFGNSVLVVCGAYGAIREQFNYSFGKDSITSLNWRNLENCGNVQ